MQARVAQFRASLEHEDQREPRQTCAEDDQDHAAFEARTQFYQQRINAALADMAARLNDEPTHAQGATGLDVASRAWLDQRFSAMRRRFENALTQSKTLEPGSEICSALEEARKRLNAMERRLADSEDRQQSANREIIGLINAHTRDTHDNPNKTDTELEQRLKNLQQGFDRAMNELENVKTGTQRLAVRASATVARQTARATALHVAKAVREAAPEHRFARLEEGLNGCFQETRTLRNETGAMQQTLEDGLEDLRGRINELTLVTRRAAAAPLHANARPGMEALSGASATASRTAHARNEPSNPAEGTSPQSKRTEVKTGYRTRNRDPRSLRGRLISRLGFALVVGLLVAASFAMLYAQLSDGVFRAPAPGSVKVNPTVTNKEEPSKQGPERISDDMNGTYVLPGIILITDNSGKV